MSEVKLELLLEAALELHLYDAIPRWRFLSEVTRRAITDTVARKRSGALTREQTKRAREVLRELVAGDLQNAGGRF
jgi:hypothetical protein